MSTPTPPYRTCGSEISTAENGCYAMRPWWLPDLVLWLSGAGIGVVATVLTVHFTVGCLS